MSDAGRLIRQDLEPVLEELFKRIFPLSQKFLKEAERLEAQAPGEIWHHRNDMLWMVGEQNSYLLGPPYVKGGLDWIDKSQVPQWFKDSHPIEHCEEEHG